MTVRALKTAPAPVPETPSSAADELERAIEQGKRAPFATVAEITPELARELLKRNHDNRQIYPGLVGTIAADIREGRWQLNGEALVLSIEGDLNDGQHRLRAILEAKIAVPSVLVFGVTRSSRETLDTGRRRYAGDVLHFEGFQNANATSAVVRAVLAYERSGGADLKGTRYISTAVQLERARADLAISEAAGWGAYAYRYCRDFISGTQVGAARYLLEQIDPIDGATFIEQVAFGEKLQRGGAAYETRRALMGLEGRRIEWRLAIVLRGFIRYRRGGDVKPGELHHRLPFPAPRELAKRHD